jgi:hypothetical protein
MGTHIEGSFGDEETGYAEHAGFDPGMEAERTRKRLEEVAQWKGEIDSTTQLYHIMSNVLLQSCSCNQVQVWLD